MTIHRVSLDTSLERPERLPQLELDCKFLFVLRKDLFESFDPPDVALPHHDSGCQLPVFGHPRCTLPVDQSDGLEVVIDKDIVGTQIPMRQAYAILPFARSTGERTDRRIARRWKSGERLCMKIVL